MNDEPRKQRLESQDKRIRVAGHPPVFFSAPFDGSPGSGKAGSQERDLRGRTLSRSKTRALGAEFISKIESGLQELEETVYWFELLGDARIADPSKLNDLLNEAEELTSIFVASVKTVKKRA